MARISKAKRTMEIGPGFVDAVSAAAARRGAPPYRPVRTLVVRPTMDLGRMAAAYIRASKMEKGSPVARRLLSLVNGALSGRAGRTSSAKASANI